MTTPPSFAEIDVQGPDAETFLQGQLANDVSSIEQGRWRYGCYCVPDGRVQALLMIARPGVQQWRLLLPADVALAVTLRLQRYKLRARCTISSHEVVADHGNPAAENSASYRCAAFELTVAAGSVAPMSSSAWARQRELDIPWIVAATSERFLPQMLGLQRLQAFSLRKGCFPGQEVVARTHFLGRVKRRLVRLLRTSGDVSLAPGAELCLQAGASASAGVLLSTAEDHLPTLAVVTDEAVAGSELQAMNPRENATFAIDRDVIGTFGDEVLNGRYDPPFSA